MFNPKPKGSVDFSFPFQCAWLKLNGSWPLDTNNKYFKLFYNIWSWYVILSVGLTIYFQSAYLFSTFGDIMKTTENCCTTFMGALNFVRLLHLRLFQKDFRKLIEKFITDIWIVKGTNQKIEKQCEHNMLIFRAMSVMLMSLIVLYCTVPLIILFMDPDIEEKPFPYKMEFFFDANHGFVYVLTYIFTSFSGMCVVTTLFAEDSLFGFFVSYACGQFRILHENINQIIPNGHKEAISQYGKKKLSADMVQIGYRRQLHKIAKTHSTLINFCKYLEKFYSPILLINFVISSILICMVGFQIVTGKSMFIGDYVKFLLYILSSLSQLFVLCWNGNKLIQDSTDTSWYLYSCNWEGGHIINLENKKISPYYYPGGITFRKELAFMILRSHRPVSITALKFSVLSLQSFTKILSTSGSYFTLLQTLLEK